MDIQADRLATQSWALAEGGKIRLELGDPPEGSRPSTEVRKEKEMKQRKKAAAARKRKRGDY